MKSAAPPPSLPPDPHSQPPEPVLAALGTSRKGLTTAEATRRLETHGANILPEPPRRGWISRIAGQFASVLVLILLVAAVVTLALGHHVDAGVILAVVLLNAGIGLVQEGRAEQAMASIRRMLALQASVLRDGSRRSLPASELVPGDIVLIEAGDRVPADLRLIAVRALSVSEAALTGESVPVEKDPAAQAADTPLADRRGMAFSGTMVTRGTGRGVVVATGTATELGRIGGLMAAVPDLSTPLLRRMDQLASRLSVIILATSAGLLLWGHWIGHLPFAELFMAVVGLAVAAIPEGLPAVMSVTLAIGVQAMARRNAIVRHLPAIEAVGAVTVICTDKTGTLTRNEMSVAEVETPGGTVRLDDTGEDGGIGALPGLGDLARAAALCNDAALLRTGAGWTVSGDPMEGALRMMAMRAGPVDPVAAATGWTRRDALPFDARHRFMATLDDGPDGLRILHLKGAPEAVIDMCDGIDRAEWHDRAHRMAARGLRVIALAMRPEIADRIDPDRPPEGLCLLGLAGLIDPPRPEAIAAVARCRRAGITVKMITGDHAATASAIAAEVGLEDPDRVLTGAEIDAMDDAALIEAAGQTTVFARTSPEHKLRLVAALQARGEMVAMTGDGVNDAPALKRADIGVAMGASGTEAAKEAADLVLADDNFATLAAAVAEGRRVFDNLRKVIGFELPTSAGESLVVALALMLALPLPVTPVQILWVNLVTGVTLGIALAFEPAEARSMARAARGAQAPLMTRGMVWHVAFVSVLFAVAVFAVQAWAKAAGHGEALSRTMALNTLVVLEIFHLFYIRNLHGTSLKWAAVAGTPAIWISVGLVVAAQLAVTYVPALQAVFGTVAVPLPEGLGILATGFAFLLALEAEKFLRLRRAG
ncbi:HAD family hydrolase [Aliigemmobacter aestuarii]|uniref:HAD family hydrolase n=1 Tax=Aliigemmobacter aestuarii TaxID=1445661 RepID=A0A4S3MKP2_9RHOB|nr:HAD-IC family P-type ATPase [Gemmobacter aestuarii]THD81512.1 HAD family hydrolase [Gemmobacter aestuarii]